MTVTFGYRGASARNVSRHFGSGSTAITCLAIYAVQNGVTPIHAPMSKTTVSASTQRRSASNVCGSHSSFARRAYTCAYSGESGITRGIANQLGWEMAQPTVKRLPLPGLVKIARNAGNLLRPNPPPRALAPSRLPSSLAKSVTCVLVR
jgi:hypothetical protein